MGKKEKGEGKLVPEEEKEGKNLLGQPTFVEMENGRFKCVETGHELPSQAREAYADSKHCRLGLIDSALSRRKPPLNMFEQDPQSRSRLICKLTGLTVNKIEEHIWKHINGKRFLNMLEKKELETQTQNGLIGEKSEEATENPSKAKGASSAKKTKKQKHNIKTISEVKEYSENDSEQEVVVEEEEEEFWMPPAGERWDFDDGGDRWGSGSESDPETGDASGEDDAIEEGSSDAGELSERTKRMAIEIGPSSFASRKKKKKTTHST